VIKEIRPGRLWNINNNSVYHKIVTGLFLTAFEVHSAHLYTNMEKNFKPVMTTLMMIMHLTGAKYVRVLKRDAVPTLNLPGVGMVDCEQRHQTEGCSNVCHNVSSSYML